MLGGAAVAFCAIVETRTGYNVFNHMRTVFPFLQDTGERASEVRNGALRAEASAQHPIALGVALSLCLPLALALVTRVTGHAAAHHLRAAPRCCSRSAWSRRSRARPSSRSP